MSSSFTATAKNAALDAVGSGATWVALFHGDPAGAGVEITGGSPAYARKQVTFASASSSSKATTGAVTIDVPAAAVVDFWALYSASTAGTQWESGSLPVSETFGGQGTYVVDSVTLSATG